MTIVFLSGWLCRPTVFSQQIKSLNADHSIIAPDYTEFVLSQPKSTSQILQRSIDFVCQSLDKITDPMIIIGHSMGGVFALELAHRLKYSVIGSLIIDTTMPNPPTTQDAEFIAALQDTNGKNTLRTALINSMFNPAMDNKPVMMAEFDQMISTWKQSPNLFTTQLDEAIRLDKSALLQQHHQPLCYISSQPQRGDVEAIKRYKPDTQFRHVNSGHFAMLNQPHELTQLIKTFINTLKIAE